MKAKHLIVNVALLVMFLAWPGRPAFADPLVWQTPYGTMGLPLTATEVLLGYDGILKQSIAGASVPVYSTPKNILTASIGAVAPWPSSGGVSVEPYVGLGHDILREIPGLNQFKSAHLNVFGRYAATQGGRFGAGAAVSYAFAGGSLEPDNQLLPSAKALMPIASRLNLLSRPLI